MPKTKQNNLCWKRQSCLSGRHMLRSWLSRKPLQRLRVWRRKWLSWRMLWNKNGMSMILNFLFVICIERNSKLANLYHMIQGSFCKPCDFQSTAYGHSENAESISRRYVVDVHILTPFLDFCNLVVIYFWAVRNMVHTQLKSRSWRRSWRERLSIMRFTNDLFVELPAFSGVNNFDCLPFICVTR